MWFMQDILSSTCIWICCESLLTLILINQEQKRCLTGNGNCPISHDIQRKCIRCRLQRCFAAGMTTDYFLTDKEKENDTKIIHK
jgi:hypothetical protein